MIDVAINLGKITEGSVTELIKGAMINCGKNVLIAGLENTQKHNCFSLKISSVR